MRHEILDLSDRIENKRSMSNAYAYYTRLRVVVSEEALYKSLEWTTLVLYTVDKRFRINQ